MARMTGPLLSMTARGMIAGRYVFGEDKTRQVMRYNWPGPKTITAVQAPYQQLHGWLTHVISYIKQQRPHLNDGMDDDYQMLRTIAGRRDRWNDFVRRAVIGPDHATLTSIKANWDSLTDAQRDAWDSAAATLAPSLTAYTGKAPPGWPEPVFSVGSCWYLYCWMAYLTALIPTPPTPDP